MPVPSPNDIPDLHRWGIIQQFIPPDYLKPFAHQLVMFDGKIIEGHKRELLSFLGLDSEEKAKQLWSDIWVTVAQTYGLAAVSGSTLFATGLARFVDSPSSSAQQFYLYWLLRFQFPFAQNKQKEWKSAGKVVQPFLSIVDHLVALVDLLGKTFPVEISYNEVVTVLMRSDYSDAFTVAQNCLEIIRRRSIAGGFDDLMIMGSEGLADRLKTRLGKVLANSGIVVASSSGFALSDESSYECAMRFRRFRAPAVVIRNEAGRLGYFESAYGLLKPDPKFLAISSLGVDVAGVNEANGSDEEAEDFQDELEEGAIGGAP